MFQHQQGLFAYHIPNTALKKQQKSILSEMLLDEDGIGSILIAKYTQSIVCSPLLVLETLLQVQSIKQSTSPDQLVLPKGVFESLRKTIDVFGYFTLLRGHLTNYIHSVAFYILQPQLEEIINDYLDVYIETHPVAVILSNALVSVLLSPLEIIRTRYIHQI